MDTSEKHHTALLRDMVPSHAPLLLHSVQMVWPTIGGSTPDHPDRCQRELLSFHGSGSSTFRARPRKVLRTT